MLLTRRPSLPRRRLLPCQSGKVFGIPCGLLVLVQSHGCSCKEHVLDSPWLSTDIFGSFSKDNFAATNTVFTRSRGTLRLSIIFYPSSTCLWFSFPISRAVSLSSSNSSYFLFIALHLNFTLNCH